jgi:hypothetical protein
MKPRNPIHKLCLAVLLSTSIPLLAGEAHVHGQAQLEIVVEGDLLSIRFESPLDNLLSFERAPRNERERQAVRRMATQLRDGAALLQPSPAAECLLLDTRLDAPILGSELLSPPAKDAPGETVQPAEKQMHATDGHAELSAIWRFRCARPAELQDLTLKLFKTFSGLHRIDAVAIGTKGQRATRLSARQPQIRW